MSSQMGNSMMIEKLKRDLAGHVANLRAATEWADFVRLYRTLRTVEELEDTPKTSLEELLGIMPAKRSDLALGDQVESEPAAEIEKGS
jgi:hypothetical protein